MSDDGTHNTVGAKVFTNNLKQKLCERIDEFYKDARGSNPRSEGEWVVVYLKWQAAKAKYRKKEDVKKEADE